MSPREWRGSVVSDDGTHHVREGRPLYDARFDEVLAFHEPGLAPVRDGSGAHHVDADGQPAYAARFQRTFGFYEGLAAVVTDGGWAHIRPDGSFVSPLRWAWTGNFQGGRCAVRDAEGRYGHLGPDGRPVYEPRFRYAGDYRDGIAVVQREDGLSTHVDRGGEEVHGHWYVDLDVFHKGYARARGERGWTHVNRLGHPVYRRRFAAVEPFYNGQARVERDDGGLEVIDEAGRTLVELRAARRSPLHAVSAELVSFWRCEAVYAAVDAGLFDRMPVADEGIPEPVRRLLGALGELGLVRRDGEPDRTARSSAAFELATLLASGDGGGRVGAASRPGADDNGASDAEKRRDETGARARIGEVWSTTEAGAHLRADHPHSLLPAARYWARDGRRDWAALPRAVRDPSWRAHDPFAEAAPDPARVTELQAALAPYAAHDYAGIGELVDPGATVIDAGGGSGALSVALLRAWPDTRAVVLDRPEVARMGRVPPELGGRMRFVGGDLFAPWPIRADTIVLARVLHDWPDERAVEILKRAREAAEPGGRLFVVDMVRPADGFEGGLLSLHLLLSTGGEERTVDELHELLWRAGWELYDVRRRAGVVDVAVAREA